MNNALRVKKCVIFKFMNDELKTSQNGLEFIAKWEGCILHPYKDIAGLRTIGIGHLIKSDENYPDGTVITKEKALDILSQDVKKCEDAIKQHITVELSQDQFDALVSFGFNCGVGVYSNSGVARALSSGNYDQVPPRLLDWSKANVNGQLTTIKGLYDRRKAEGDLFSGVVTWTPQILAGIQKKLSNLGLYTKTIDGTWGPGTNAAICNFALSKGIQISDTHSGIPKNLFDEIDSLP